MLAARPPKEKRLMNCQIIALLPVRIIAIMPTIKMVEKVAIIMIIKFLILL
jgi:hypothetical protein